MVKNFINDNVMSHSEILQYIFSNIPVQFDLIQRLVVVRNFQNFEEIVRLFPKANIIYGLRRKFLFDELTQTFIVPTNEGIAKMLQYEIQVEFINELEHRNIEFTELLLRSDEDMWSNWAVRLANLMKINRIENIDAVVVGSTYNIRFLTDRYLNHPILNDLDLYFDKIFKSPDFQEYYNYRLSMILLEEDYVNHNYYIDKSLIFDVQLNPYPTRDVFSKTFVEKNKIHRYDDRIRDLLNQRTVVDYIKADYIVHTDRLNNTNIFKDVYESSNCLQPNDKFIDYQLIKAPKGNIINFNWVSSSQISGLLYHLQAKNELRDLIYFGKCGYLKDNKNIGDIVTPIKSKCFLGKEISLINSLLIREEDITKTITVDSPLQETKSELRKQVKNGYDSIEMELYYILDSLSTKTDRSVAFYISDLPLSTVNLSTRLELLLPRIKCAEIAFDRIANQYF